MLYASNCYGVDAEWSLCLINLAPPFQKRLLNMNSFEEQAKKHRAETRIFSCNSEFLAIRDFQPVMKIADCMTPRVSEKRPRLGVVV